MILTTVLGAMTLAALGPTSANTYYTNDRVSSPQIVEIRGDMIDNHAVNRTQHRFSNRTRGTVVGVSNPDGSIQWASSDREKLGGQDAPALIYIRIFDGIFAIDPFQPLPAATDETARMLFRGTTLETDQAWFGQHEADRTKELVRKLEQARHTWLRDNGFFGPRVYTNPNAEPEGEQTSAKAQPKPSAVFERPADIPRGKSHEEVRADDKPNMASVAQVMNGSDERIRISMPHTMAPDVVARVEKMNKRNAEKGEKESAEVAINETNGK